MPINEQHLLSLLTDILKNHEAQQYLSVDEQRQIQKLCNQLLKLGVNDDQLIATLQAIEQNEWSSNNNVEQWISVIEQNIIS